MRLKVAHRGVERFHFLRGYIRRIGNNQIIGSEEVLRGLERIDGHTVNAAGQMQLRHIAARHTQRRGGNVSQSHARVLDAARHGQTDTPGAGAKIQNARILFKIHRLFDSKLGHDHGIVPRNEHVGRNGQRHAVKIPLP